MLMTRRSAGCVFFLFCFLVMALSHLPLPPSPSSSSFSRLRPRPSSFCLPSSVIRRGGTPSQGLIASVMKDGKKDKRAGRSETRSGRQRRRRTAFPFQVPRGDSAITRYQALVSKTRGPFKRPRVRLPLSKLQSFLARFEMSLD